MFSSVDVAMAITTNVLGPCARLMAAVVLACLSMAVPFSPAAAQHVVVLVNGQPITSLDIAFRSRLNQLSTRKKPSREEVLNELIDEKLKIKEAKRFGVEASKAEINASFAAIAKRMGATPTQLSQILSKQGSNESSLKSRLAAELVWSKLVRGRYQASLQIREKDILATMEANNPHATSGYEYVLRPILIVVPRGSSKAVIAQKQREAESLRARFQSCEQGIRFARALRDVAVRAQITRNAADLSPQLRGILDKIEIGHLSAPEVTANGIQMFALCGKRSTTQDTPLMREARNKIFAERFKAKAQRYLTELRRGAMIEYRE
jgi:peptidyl-prolyl cis-trans isomerase SurA